MDFLDLLKTYGKQSFPALQEWTVEFRFSRKHGRKGTRKIYSQEESQQDKEESIHAFFFVLFTLFLSLYLPCSLSSVLQFFPCVLFSHVPWLSFASPYFHLPYFSLSFVFAFPLILFFHPFKCLHCWHSMLTTWKFWLWESWYFPQGYAMRQTLCTSESGCGRRGTQR